MVARKTDILPTDFDEQELSRPISVSQFVEPDAPEDIALSNVLADLGGESDAKVNVYLMEPGKGNSYVGTFDPVSFSIEAIQQTYGAGEYKIHVRRDGRLVANRTIRIAPPKSPQLPAVIQPAQNSVEISKLAEAMNSGFQQMAQMLANTVQAISANQPKPKSTQEMLNEMVLMKQIIGGDTPKSDMEMFMQGLNFAKEITPREGEPGTGEIILEAIKNFGGLLSTKSSPALSPAPALAMPSPHVPAQAAAQAPTENHVQNVAPPQTNQEDQMSFARKMYLSLLLSNAKADNDPMTYAAMAVDLQGEDEALTFARRPDWFELLCSELPEARDYREWFGEMRAAIFTLTEQPNPDIQEEINNSDSPANAISVTEAAK